MALDSSEASPGFDWVDPLALAASLTPEERMIGDRAGARAPGMTLVAHRLRRRRRHITRASPDMQGGDGISGDDHVMRRAANLETVNTHARARDVRAPDVGRTIIGESAF